MKNKILLFMSIMMCVLMHTAAFAQAKTVTGSVSDDSKMPVPGVNVMVKGTKTGVATDFDGKYSISVPEGATLVFSFVGFVPKEQKSGLPVNTTLF